MASSVFRSLISFWDPPWYFLVCYVQSIINTSRVLLNLSFKVQNGSQRIVTYFRPTVNIDTTSYQICFYFYYCKIHLRRYIDWYCLLIYEDSIIFIIMFYIKLSQNIVFIRNIESILLWYLQTKHFCISKKIHKLWHWWTTTSSYTNSCYPDHATTKRRSNIRGQPIVVRYI